MKAVARLGAVPNGRPRSFVGALALGLLLSLAGCADTASERGATAVSLPATDVPGTPSPTLSDGVASGIDSGDEARAARQRLFDDPIDTVASDGIRVVERLRDDGLGWQRVRERLITDGHGGFLLKHVDSLTATDPPEPEFGLLKSRRAAFYVRYEGFRVRNEGAFVQNWEVHPVGMGTVVAGRSCEVLEVRRRNAPDADYYVLQQDELTGMVLHEERRRADGTPTERRYYQSVTFDPDLTNVGMHAWNSLEQDLDPAQDLDAQMGFEVFTPLALPAGFRPFEVQSTELAPSTGAAASLTAGGPWCKIVYSDGVDVLLFLQRPTRVDLFPGGAGTFGPLDGAATSGVARRGPAPSPGDRVLVDELGSYRFSASKIGGRETLLMGRLGEDLLLDVLESTIR